MYSGVLGLTIVLCFWDYVLDFAFRFGFILTSLFGLPVPELTCEFVADLLLFTPQVMCLCASPQ